jgi:lipopolysaccharide/colanic/teichoic acid biosynthesis glycosyltransferase
LTIDGPRCDAEGVIPDAGAGKRRLGRVLKRALDISVASSGLVALSPALGLLALAELYFHGWPPVFAQRRPGLGGKIFTLYKFRTMTNERGPDGELLPDAKRLTAFGHFLRSTSLDELPELLNVVTGDMSLVGPRPLLVQYLELYDARQRRRHEVRPGLTGWAQIHGRNSCSWEEKFEYDVWYVDNWSFALDLRILVRTAAMVLRREGISAEGEATMAPFRGSGQVATVNGTRVPGNEPSARSDVSLLKLNHVS